MPIKAGVVKAYSGAKNAGCYQVYDYQLINGKPNGDSVCPTY